MNHDSPFWQIYENGTDDYPWVPPAGSKEHNLMVVAQLLYCIEVGGLLEWMLGPGMSHAAETLAALKASDLWELVDILTEWDSAIPGGMESVVSGEVTSDAMSTPLLRRISRKAEQIIEHRGDLFTDRFMTWYHSE